MVVYHELVVAGAGDSFTKFSRGRYKGSFFALSAGFLTEKDTKVENRLTYLETLIPECAGHSGSNSLFPK